MKSAPALLASTWLLASVLVVSCASTFDGEEGGGGNGTTSSSSSGDGTFGEGGTINTDSGLTACATDTQQGQQLPLDIVVIDDSTGSMWIRTASGQTKWDTVKSAFAAFFADPKSAGISVGLQFFPVFQNGVPNSCTSSAQCNGAGPCRLKSCSTKYKFCDTDAECGPPGPSGTCSLVLGQCHNEGEIKCNNALFCAAQGFAGACDPIVATACDKQVEECSVAAYSQLAVPVSTLPGAASGLNAAFNSHWPNGLTTTRPALEGAIAAAKARLTANPGHTVVVVYATDGHQGNTTTCAPNEIGDVVNVAAQGLTSGVRTFVIGVFAPSEAAASKANMDQVATAGGTNKTYLVDTSSSNVTVEFTATLNQIRGTALPCEFELPVPDSGTADYAKLNVQFTAANGNVTVIGYATSVAGCDPTKGGWYYDVDPATGTPHKILLCPASCTMVAADPGAKIDIVQGCKTVLVSPN